MMQYGEIPGVGKPVSRLVYGSIHVSIDRLDDCMRVLDDALDCGYNTIDTARIYGTGERTIGEWMHRRGNREDVVVLTKGCHHSDRDRVTPEDMADDIETSLQELQTDYIDLYVLHRDDPKVPVGPIVEALNEHRRAGRIRAFGGSNWTQERVAEANAYAREHGLEPFALSSPHFGLVLQVQEPWPNCVSISGLESEPARRWHAETGVPVFAWSSLGRGMLSGRITPENHEKDQEKFLDDAARTAFYHPVNMRRVERAFELSADRGISVPLLGLAWALGSPMDVYPLVGAQNRAELEENLKVFDISLTQDERAWLNLETDAKPGA